MRKYLFRNKCTLTRCLMMYKWTCTLRKLLLGKLIQVILNFLPTRISKVNILLFSFAFTRKGFAACIVSTFRLILEKAFLQRICYF